jgi:L-histidine N-alpha-methyltransferase
VVTDFEHDQPLPYEGHRRLLAFLGSTIGNFEAEAARDFLRDVAGRMQQEDAFLIGFDLVKDIETLLRAYDDAQGVTAEFNRNLLRVMNRELDADFDLDQFEHAVRYDEREARIEMHLVSRTNQTVRLDALDLEVSFAPGESIRTELSHKYTRRSVEALLEDAGLALDLWETDPDSLFALGLARRR